MKLEHFHYLLEIHRLRSISAASRKLHIGQTTLSAIVKTAEAEVGFQIFQRTPKGISTTSAGEEFMTFAWEINLQYEKLIALQRRALTGNPDITILMAPTISVRLSIPILEQFYRFNLSGGLRLEECSSENIPDYILSHKANIGLLYLTEEKIQQLNCNSSQTALSIDVLYEDNLYLLVSEKHHLAKSAEIDVRSLTLDRLATIKLMKNDMILGSLPSRIPNITSFFDIYTMYQAIREQNMVGFTPGFSTTAEAAEEIHGLSVLALRNTEHPNRLFLCMITCNGLKLRRQEEVLVSCVKRYFKKLNAN